MPLVPPDTYAAPVARLWGTLAMTYLKNRGLPLLVVIMTLPLVSTMFGANRAIPDDNLAYPVLITLKNGSTGSGFFVNTTKAIYLVTAKHVLFDPVTQKLLDVSVELLSYSKDLTESTRNVVILDLSILQNNGTIKPHPSQDVVAVEISTVVRSVGQSGTSSPLPGVTLVELAKGGLLGVSLDNVKPFEQVLTGNEVIVFGYPTSLGLAQFQQIDPRRPLLRKGIVAGTDPATRSIIIDCPSYFGNSGGPVVELDREAFQTHLSVIGVISQYVPFADAGRSNTFMILSNSGYSIVTPMDYVLDLVK